MTTKTKSTLREQIAKLTEDCHWDVVGVGYATDQILQAVSDYCNDLIGDDDQEYTERKSLNDEWVEFRLPINEQIRNQLRQEQRDKLKKDLEW